MTLATVVPAVADFKVQMPEGETGEFAIEPLGDYGHDPNPAHSGELSTTEEFEYGVNGFWRTELELEQERNRRSRTIVGFQVRSLPKISFSSPSRGQYFPWMLAFFAEFGKVHLQSNPNEFALGPIFRKEMFGTINTVNLFMEKEVGSGSAGRPFFLYAWETRFGLRHADRAGLSGLWPTERLFEGFNSHWPQDNRIGPQLFGIVSNIGPGTLEWNPGILFGVTSAAPRETIRWQLEYEIHFCRGSESEIPL